MSSDPYTDKVAQHATEVEPDTYSFGDTIVSAFQVGRVAGGGASNIGWATSSDRGAHWTHGFLPHTTANTGGIYNQTSDASVAYDPKDRVWLISFLGIFGNGNTDVAISRSTDGGLTWSNPIVVDGGAFYDKNWTVCDTHPASSYYGRCYTEYDNVDLGDAEDMRTSTNGGATWGARRNPADGALGLGGQPVVQPNGTVIVPFSSLDNSQRSFKSTNGGGSWGASVVISTVDHHMVAGLETSEKRAMTARDSSLRESPMPSAEIDAAGKVYAVWSDCRFRSNCAGNDIIMSTTTDGTTWSTPTRVPIDAASSAADHFTPGIGVDPSTSGTSARLALTYYYYPSASCTDTTCQLYAGYLSSTDGGHTWTSPIQLAGPMKLAWLPTTDAGRMFGDYIATAVVPGGNAVTVIPVASQPSGSTFNMAMYATVGGLQIGSGTTNTVGPIHSGVSANLCLDDRSAGTANHTWIQIWGCDGTAAQQWNVAGDGTLRVLGGCMDVTGAGTTAGTKVQYYQCNGTVAQQWQAHTDGTLYNPHSGMCLEDPGATTTTGTQLQISACNQTNAQKWTLP